jgi:catechol 2,3-dioxygenase-like lactoylglutathione lyase family enzyme
VELKMEIDHVAIAVKDIARATNWYKESFDAKVIYQDETWAMIKIGNSKVALTLPNLHPPHIAILVDSVDCFPKKTKAKKHKDKSSYAYVTDPDGNVIEYICYESN